jgi:hypothetical protein
MRRASLASWAVLASTPCAALAADAPHLPEGVLTPLGATRHSLEHHAPCVAPQLEAQILRAIAEHYAAHGAPFSPRGPSLYPFFPMGGNPYHDIAATSFVDLDPSSAQLDFECNSWATNGHNGIDCELRSFAEQAIGVPVFAVLPGTVIAKDDGHPDMNTVQAGQPGNYVILDHGNNRHTWYLHLKNASVTPQLGQVVRAGEQLGLAASSGNSGSPHLHFESRQGGLPYEPHGGPCRPGPSGWLDQDPVQRQVTIADAAPSFIPMWTVPGWPFESPHTGQLAITDNDHWIWINVRALPANSTYALRYIRPSGQLEFQSPTFPFNNTQSFPRAWFWFWGYVIPDMHNPVGLGTWRIQLDINNAQVLDLPVEVRAARTPDFNRPPAALQSLALDPPAPAESDAILCRITTSLVNDDPDYDTLRYQYRWLVNASVVRLVTTAGHADALPAFSAPPGATVRCEVTPMDHALSAPTSSVQTTISGLCTADVDDGSSTGTPDGGVTIDDLIYDLTLFEAGDVHADVDDGTGTGTPDLGVTIDDLIYFLTRFEAGC